MVHGVTGDARLKTAAGQWWGLTGSSDFVLGPDSCVVVAPGARVDYEKDGVPGTLIGETVYRGAGSNPTRDCKANWTVEAPPLVGSLEHQRDAVHYSP